MILGVIFFGNQSVDNKHYLYYSYYSYCYSYYYYLPLRTQLLLHHFTSQAARHMSNNAIRHSLRARERPHT